jgi:hypothetical protein
MGEVVQFRRPEPPVAASPLELLVQTWGEGDVDLETAIRKDCGKLLERYSLLPDLALQLPSVDALDGPQQAELAEALKEQINEWASEWHTRMLFEMLGSEILRLRELFGYGPLPGSST